MWEVRVLVGRLHWQHLCALAVSEFMYWSVLVYEYWCTQLMAVVQMRDDEGLDQVAKSEPH